MAYESLIIPSKCGDNRPSRLNIVIFLFFKFREKLVNFNIFAWYKFVLCPPLSKYGNSTRRGRKIDCLI